MKRLVALSLFSILIGFSVFSESIHGFNLITGYKNNNLEYDGLDYSTSIWRLSLGYTYTLFPSYNSIVGFSLSPNVGFDIPFGTTIENNGSSTKINPNYEYEHDDFGSSLFFNTDIALNFRFRRTLNKGFPYIKTGATWQATMFSIAKKDDYFTGLDKVSGMQQTIGTFFEIGFQPRAYSDYFEHGADSFFSYYRSDISLRFIYDFLTANPLTDDNFVKSSNFGIMLIWKPWQRSGEHSNDKAIMSKFRGENGKYRLFEEKNETVGNISYFREKISNISNEYDGDIENISIKSEYHRKWDIGTSSWVSEPIIMKVIYTKHMLGKGKVGTNEYTAWTEENISLPFYTDEDKQKAFDAIVAESECRRQQKKRVAENEQIAQSKHDVIYEKALTSKNVIALVNYIDENRGSKYFHDEAYTEIAKLVTKNTKIELKELPYISNPYVLDKNCLYYVSSLPVYQWTGNGSFLAEVGSNKVIFIRNAYDLSKIGSGVQNAYLKYVGTYEYTNRYSGVQVVAEFDLVYSFGFSVYEDR